VRGQQVVQVSRDIFLGRGRMRATHYYVRKLRDTKDPSPVSALTAAASHDAAAFCGAGAPGRVTRLGSPATWGVDDGVDHAMAVFAIADADQTTRDDAARISAVKTGWIAAETGM